MALSLRANLTQAIEHALRTLYAEAYLEGDLPKVELSPPKAARHGDYACAVALSLARSAKKSPREIAEKLKVALGDAGAILESAEVAGPGFLNLRVAPAAWRRRLSEVLVAGVEHIRSDAGAGKKVLIEYVSANPTGPLHVGHGRGAVTGDIIARLLGASGFKVAREFYVNDFGHQVDIMARSIHLRYEELLGRAFELPEAFYPGEYIVELAEEIRRTDADKWLDAPEELWIDSFRSRGVTLMLRRIQEDLKAFGVEFDSFVSEHELLQRVDLDEMIGRLKEAGTIYEQDGKEWFRSTDFDDTKDRVVRRDDGRTTYFASDIAYHDDKLKRGYDQLINVWGADHGGYITRVKAGIKALGHDNDPLEVISLQMVSLSRSGEAVRMGKRLGTAVWLRDVIDEAGRDATRYFFAMRRPQAQMDFDLDLATKKSLDNPVYYAQMGHARMCSIARKAADMGLPKPKDAPGALDALTLPEELGLIKQMDEAPHVVAMAARDREPHTVVHYIQDLIGQFHGYYTRYQGSEKVISEDQEKTRARLLLCQALRVTLHALLVEILGVDAPESMYLEDFKTDSGEDVD